ncbi:MAG: hypothetical protein QM809_11395 [Gordonia sp. (in: high G+C Gram-positive bacteria)]|uniref:hypothetical protein n=1 Tax=Gordonia sp. (in: high G+C Gram-positive bacteria) TaxID=84139 RepID=UPI0039E58CC4
MSIQTFDSWQEALDYVNAHIEMRCVVAARAAYERYESVRSHIRRGALGSLDVTVGG